MKKKVNFTDWVEFAIQDPIHLNEREHPAHVTSVFAFVSRSWNDMNNDRSRPQSQQIDDVIVYITDDRHEVNDIAHGGGYTRYVCGNCGSGLGLTQCYGCGAKFRDNHFRMGASMPMPRKIATFLREHGHIFGQDPEIVWQKER